MYSLKDKISSKLPRFFSHSPPPESDTYHDPDTSEVGINHREGKSVLSLSFSPFSWRSSKWPQFTEWHSQYVECEPIPEIKQMLDSDRVCQEGGRSSSGSTSSSEVFEKTSCSNPWEKAMPQPNMCEESVFVSTELYAFLESCVPNIVKGCQWVLLYSTMKHGISLRTLIRNSSFLSGPCLLIVGDLQGAVFGGLLECPLTPTLKRKYQGKNQTFVFTTVCGKPKIFRPTGLNRFYYMCLNDMLALGGGADFALRLNEDLLGGTSGTCETFGSPCLAHSSEFELKSVEVWGFKHASRYLN